jgi:O-antigen ligase/tetratricopeptide (TPR) repeat protein
MPILEKTLRWIVIIGVFALPFICLIVTSSLFFPFITGKNFTFRVIVEVITGAWLALALVYPKYRPRRSWILGAFAVFIIVIAIADAQGANPFKSFWSNYERMDGWVTLAHLFAYLVVAAAVVNTEKLWTRLWQLTLAVSACVSIYGLLQVAGMSTLGGGGGGLSTRVDATFGNPIYLAVYMLFHIFIAALLWVQMRAKRVPGARLPFSILYGGVIVLDTIALFFTGTRGTILGLVGGAVLALLILAFLQGSRTVRFAAAASVIAVIVAGAGLWLGRDTALVQNVGFLDRLATISASDTTIKSRFLNMGIAWQGVKERPILGWGQENYAIVFDKYYDPRMYADEPWFDRVHNIIFDWLVAGGFLGLIAYLSIFAAVLWTLWKSKAFSVSERAIVTGLLAGYFIHNLTVFDNVTSYTLFATVLAYIAWRVGSAEHSPAVVEKEFLPQNSLPFAAAACAFLVWGTAWFVNANALAENRTLLAALEPQSAGIQQNLDLFEQAASYGTYGTQEVREQLVQAGSQVASAQNIPAATKQQFFETASQQMTLQEAASPLDARFPLFLGILDDSYGDYANAAVALERAHELSPRKQSILFQIGQNDEAQGDTVGALAAFAEAYNLEPDYDQARIMYAAELIRAGNDGLADQLLQPLVASGAAADPQIEAAYAARKEYGKIATVWEAYVAANPQDMQGYFTLAAAYYASGNPAQAIDALQRAEAVSPDIKSQADAVIQQIQNGTVQVGQ